MSTVRDSATAAADTAAAPPLGSLPIAEDARRRAASWALSRSEPYDLSRPVTSYVDQWARQRPDHPAVVDASGGVGYAALADRARRTATGLRTRGVREGDVVAVGGERGAEVVTVFLALELLGAVYLPVDASWPAARSESVLADSRAVLLVTTGDPGTWSALLRAADTAGCPVHRAAAGPEAEPFAGPARLNSLDQVRYLLYTSGSTGRPKGALVEHAGMLNHLWAKVQDLGLDGTDRLAQTAPLGFDISVWQMLAPLLTGGTVQVFGDDTAQDGPRLLAAAAQGGTTVLEVVPTLIRFLLDACGDGTAERPLLSLRWMIATGEELPPAVARRWVAAFPSVGLLNAYGPTECSDDVTHAVLSCPDDDVRHLPIGGPIGNVVLYLLRRTGQGWDACPPGEAGELFVGGVAVGRGYLGDPERTRAAFYRDPFTGRGRLYRTGDAVRRLPSGELEYLGRVDRQVKLGGVRMELAEIEAVLGGHPSVGACAVALVEPPAPDALVARESAWGPVGPGAPRLVAYLSPALPAWSSDELVAHLTGLLPRQMVPRTYVPLPELPLTRNGKIDYAALPAPPHRDRPEGKALVPPSGDAENRVAALVADVLGLGAVGRHDAFLELGGDSLNAMRLVSRLRDAGFGATLRDVLVDGSPAALAVLAPSPDGGSGEPVAEAAESGPPRPVPSPPNGGRRTRPLTPQQAGVYYHWRLDPDSPSYSYQGTLELDGPLDHERLSRAWRLLLEENPLLLARFDEDEATGEPLHAYPHWTVPLGGIEDLGAIPDGTPDDHYRLRARTEAARPFDLRSEPPLRVRAFALGPEAHRLLVTMHEILLDGWAATVLFDRLAALYGLATDPDAVPDDRLAARYDGYLDWHRRLLGSDEVSAAGRYWRQRLEGELPVLDVSGGPRPASPDYRGELVEVLLEAHAAEAVQRAAQRSRSTVFVHLLAAYALALTYYGDTDEVIVGVPMANRDRPEQIEVPAFMLSMLPLRLRTDPDSTLAEFTAQVHDLVIEAYAAADYPFGWILRQLPEATRSSAVTPVFQTMLNMPAYPARSTRSGDLGFQFVELETGYTKYDCALYAQPHGSDQLVVQLAYQVQLMDDPAARRLLDSTLMALRGIVESPHTAVRALNLFPDPAGRPWPQPENGLPC